MAFIPPFVMIVAGLYLLILAGAGLAPKPRASPGDEADDDLELECFWLCYVCLRENDDNDCETCGCPAEESYQMWSQEVEG